METVQQSPVGIIGFGTMGRGLARNLRLAGREVVAFDVSEQAQARARRDGVGVEASPAALAERATVILSIVPSKREVREVVVGELGLVEAATSEHVLIEMSTVDPMTILELDRKVTPSGLTILDAGVSASPRMNWFGQGTLMVGGRAESLELVRPVLEAVSSDLIHTGELGSAKVAKLVNNLMGGVSMAALAEAFQLGDLNGVEPSVLYSGMMASWARCAILERMPPVLELRPADETDEEFPDFHVDYMEKDLACVVETAQAMGASHRMANAALELFSRARAAGLGSDPMWKVIDSLEVREGPRCRPRWA